MRPIRKYQKCANKIFPKSNFSKHVDVEITRQTALSLVDRKQLLKKQWWHWWVIAAVAVLPDWNLQNGPTAKLKSTRMLRFFFAYIWLEMIEMSQIFFTFFIFWTKKGQNIPIFKMISKIKNHNNKVKIWW